MYATVRVLKIDDTFRSENRRRVHDELLPRFREIPGFVDCYLIYCDNDTEASIGIFEDKAGVNAMQNIANRFVKEFSEHLKLTVVYEGEVVVRGRETAPA